VQKEGKMRGVGKRRRGGNGNGVKEKVRGGEGVKEVGLWRGASVRGYALDSGAQPGLCRVPLHNKHVRVILPWHRNRQTCNLVYRAF